MSSLKIAILAPAADGAYGGTRWPEVMARMVTPLEAAGMAVAAVDWTTDDDLTGFDLVLALLAWGYHRDGPAPGHWHRQVTRWQAAGVRLQNPPEVLRWNADKAYLGDFEATGADYSELTGAIDYVNAIPGMKFSLVLAERAGKVKGSIRTLRDDVDVSKMAA